MGVLTIAILAVPLDALQIIVQADVPQDVAVDVKPDAAAAVLLALDLDAPADVLVLATPLVLGVIILASVDAKPDALQAV